MYKQVQTWLMCLMLPLGYDIWAFGCRLAFCHIYHRQLIEIWYTDVVCDIWMLADVAVNLVIRVPKGTYPGQKAAAETLAHIMGLYFKHKLGWVLAPIMVYQTTSAVLLLLPRSETNDEQADIFLWVWFSSMVPRFVLSVKRLMNYFDTSVIDPRITRNVKQFQFLRLLLYILGFVHLIGCIYYFLARIYLFDESTWIYAFEQSLPFYEFQSSTLSSEYLLCIFKGFCRVASLGSDPGLPGNMPELVWAMTVMFFSVYVSSLILGTLLTYLVRRDPMEVAHKERINGLRRYMTRKNVSLDLYETVIRYCDFQYHKSLNTDSTSGNDLIHSLSRSLRIEVANANYKSLILKCAKIGRPLHRCSKDFFDELVVKLYTVHVMPGDNVVHKDEIPRELYFVSRGAVQVVDEHDQVVSLIRSDVPDTGTSAYTLLYEMHSENVVASTGK